MSVTINVQVNTFEEVVIGTQTWMARNYDFGGIYPASDEDNVTDYGRLYTWTEALAISVPGWHLPTDTEWSTLITYLGGESVAGGTLKEAGTDHWDSPNTGADDSSGFTAVGAGANASNINISSRLWASTEFASGFTYYVRLSNAAATAVLDYTAPSTNTYSVRLIKD